MNPTDAELEIMFRTFWSASYPGAPPGTHALMTHTGWGRFLLQQVQEQLREVSNAA